MWPTAARMVNIKEHANLFFLYLLRSSSAGAPTEAATSSFMRPFSRSEHSAAAVQPKPPAPASVGSLLSPHVHIRTARRDDIPAIEGCNLKSLPENYPNSFYHNHLLQWPYLALVAEKTPIFPEDKQQDKRIVGYVLGRVEHGISPYDGTRIAERKTGHVSSLAVLDEYRRLGIGRELMEILHLQMRFRYNVDSSTLHVRCSNRAAQKLYAQSLGYRIVETVHNYYQDGADAFYMKLDFNAVEAEQQEEEEEPLQMAAVGGAGALRSPPTGFRERGLAALTQDSNGYFHLGRPAA